MQLEVGSERPVRRLKIMYRGSRKGVNHKTSEEF